MNGAENPFAVLTLIAAPAVLTNASSVLALGTSNRFARAVDRQRQLSSILDGSGKLDADTLDVRRRQLGITEKRAQLLIGALTRFYTSLGAFAAAALISLIGAVVVPIRAPQIEIAVTAIALIAGTIGVGGLVSGCVLLIRETRLTVQALREEANLSMRLSAHLRQSPDDGTNPQRDRMDDAVQ